MSTFQKMLAERLVAGKLQDIRNLVDDIARIARDNGVAVDFSIGICHEPQTVTEVAQDSSWESSDWESSDEGWESSSC